ncbi:MAG: hypothetical protein D3915_05925 [Candidatus Electrothrix sp. AU1_5]|nr:hypothetical protein [Candidatus Electrothrix gigas]
MKKLQSVLTVMSTGAVLALPQNVFSESIFDILVSSEGFTYQESYSSLEDVMNGIDEDYIRQQIYRYTDQSGVFSRVNLKGIPITLSFLERSTALSLHIPAIGVQETFIGATRDDSVDQLEEWLKSNGEDALTALMQELAAATPNDPIAGNPNSLMGNVVQSDYDSGFTSNVSKIKQSKEVRTDATDDNSNLVGIKARYGSYRQGGMDNKHFSLPLSYTQQFSS